MGRSIGFPMWLILAAGVAAVSLGIGRGAVADPPPRTPPADARKAKLEERDRLEKQANSLRARGKTAEALRAAEAMLAVEREVLGETHDDVIRSIELIALVHQDRGDYAAAGKAWSQVLTLLTKRLGGEHWRVINTRWGLEKVDLLARLDDGGRRKVLEADRLHDQVVDLDAKAKHEEALGPARRALALRKETQGERSPDYVTALNNLGGLLDALGRNGEALECYRRALETQEALCPHPHPKLSISLDGVATVLAHMGRLAEARPYLERSLKIREGAYPKATFPRGHAALEVSLTNLGELLALTGAFAEARGYHERALEMSQALYPEKDYPRGHERLVVNLVNLGTTSDQQHHRDEARSYVERAVAMSSALYPKEAYPRGHPRQVLALRSLGNVLRRGGLASPARDAFEKALKMSRALYPKDEYPGGNLDLVKSLTDLGELLVLQGKGGEARPYLEEALTMERALFPKSTFPQGHPALADILIGLGKISYLQGDREGALRSLAEALEMRQASFPKEQFPRGHPAVAGSLIGLGLALEVGGKSDEAQKKLQQAVGMLQNCYSRQAYPPGHRELAAGLTILGRFSMLRGNHAEAWRCRDQALRMYCDLAELLVTEDSGAEVSDDLNLLSSACGDVVECALRLRDAGEAAYAHVWRTEGTVARILGRREAPLSRKADADPAVRRLVDEWTECCRGLSRLMLIRADGTAGRDGIERVNQLTAQKDDLERRLRVALPEFAREQDLRRAPHVRLLGALPEKTVVVDLVPYVLVEQDPGRKGNRGGRSTQCCAGFLLAKGRPVRLVDLGPTIPIVDAVEQWRGSIAEGRPDPSAKVLRQKLWRPLEPYFPPGTTTVLIAPPGGFLTAIPWSALPGEKPGTLLLDKYGLATVPDAPFILDLLTAPRRTPGNPGVVLAVGGDPRKQPGTFRTLNTVARLAEPRPVLRLEGPGCTPSAVLRELPRARWAHFDTRAASADAEARSAPGPDATPPDRPGAEGSVSAGGDPPAPSGLLLGAADRPSGGKTRASARGLALLTNEAIAGSSLAGLDLAVLSACETGPGTMSGGQAGFSLQRAFHQAGARSVLAPLWEGPPEFTDALMAEFYGNLWRKKLPVVEALRQAQLTLMKSRRWLDRRTPAAPKRGDAPPPTGEGGQRLPAQWWAGFVLWGDWR